MREGWPLAVDYIRQRCGGGTATRDAWADCDSAAQDWGLGAVFDQAFCHDCEVETELVEVDFATREPTGG